MVNRLMLDAQASILNIENQRLRMQIRVLERKLSDTKLASLEANYALLNNSTGLLLRRSQELLREAELLLGEVESHSVIEDEATFSWRSRVDAFLYKAKGNK